VERHGRRPFQCIRLRQQTPTSPRRCPAHGGTSALPGRLRKVLGPPERTVKASTQCVRTCLSASLKVPDRPIRPKPRRNRCTQRFPKPLRRSAPRTCASALPSTTLPGKHAAPAAGPGTPTRQRRRHHGVQRRQRHRLWHAPSAAQRRLLAVTPRRALPGSRTLDTIEHQFDSLYPGGMAAYVPPGWPAGVHPPGSDEFERTAVTWLLDVVPPDYRLHGVLRRHPIALATMARYHSRACVEGARQGYRTARTELAEVLPEHAVDAVLAAYRTEGQRLAATARAVDLVARALRGEVFKPQLRDATRKAPGSPDPTQPS
jgi:hypothetical protein